MANIFPKWANKMPLHLALWLVVVSSLVTGLVTYYATPKYTRVGYKPIQPVPFSHAIHVGQLNIDCRYCHTAVPRSSSAGVPPTVTCMTCHTQVGVDKPSLELVRRSYESGEAIPWVRIHQTPDYVYFNYSAHVNRGISCLHCHGFIPEMDVVQHAESLSMAFCLECHREPERFIRPLGDVFTHDWFKHIPLQEQLEQGKKLVDQWQVHPPQSCSGCHR